MLQGMLQQQVFVRRGRNLRAENRIFRINVALRLTAEIAVHSMAHFVRDGRNAVVARLIIEQHKGMHAVHAPGICAGALALVFVNVNPAFGHAFMQCRQIFLAQRCQCLLNLGAGFREAAGKAVACIGNRHIHIIVMEFIYTKYILLQLDILMQRCKIIMHGINQSVVKTGRNIILCQRCFQCIFIVMHGSIKISGARRASERCSQGIAILMICIHQAGKGIFTQYAVG